MSEEKITSISKIGEEDLDAVQAISKEKYEPLPTATPDKEHFTNLMTEEKLIPPVEQGKTSLMDAVRDMNYKGPLSEGKITTQSLLAQTEQVMTKIEQVKQALEAPNINIKTSTHVKLLENKLSHIDESLRIALSKAGTEFAPQTEQLANKGVNPIERFLGYVTDGQWQLENLYGQLSTMGAQNKELSPASMLAVQIKVGQIGQELQLFYSLLSKALESVKTIMNIQV